MKKVLFLAFAATTIAVTSCNKCDEEEKVAAFSSAANAFTTAVATQNCDDMNSKFNAYKAAYNDLCDDQKTAANKDAVDDTEAALATICP